MMKKMKISLLKVLVVKKILLLMIYGIKSLICVNLSMQCNLMPVKLILMIQIFKGMIFSLKIKFLLSVYLSKNLSRI